MASEFKVTIEITTKEDFSIVELQRYFRSLLSNNGDVKKFELKTEVKES